MNEGLFIVLSGPSGAGKTSFVERALKERSWLEKTVSCTTRPPRPGEVSGKSYHFLSREEFERLRNKKAFVEWAEVYGALYGTSFKEVRGVWGRGHGIIKDLDIQGARSVRRAFSRVITVFIAPPSLQELRERFLKRGSDPSSLDIRLARAEEEMSRATDYDHIIVNGDFETAWKKLKKIVEKAGKM